MTEKNTHQHTKCFAGDFKDDEKARDLEAEIGYMLKKHQVEATIARHDKYKELVEENLITVPALLEVTVAESDLARPIRISESQTTTIATYLRDCGLMQKLGTVEPKSDQHRMRGYSQVYASKEAALRASNMLKKMFRPIEYNNEIEKKPEITVIANLVKVKLSATAASYKINFNSNYWVANDYLLKQGFKQNPGYTEYANSTLKNPNDRYREIELSKTFDQESEAKTAQEELTTVLKDLGVDMKILRRKSTLHLGMTQDSASMRLAVNNRSVGTLETYLVNNHGFGKSTIKGINYVGEEQWNQR